MSTPSTVISVPQLSVAVKEIIGGTSPPQDNVTSAGASGAVGATVSFTVMICDTDDVLPQISSYLLPTLARNINKQTYELNNPRYISYLNNKMEPRILLNSGKSNSLSKDKIAVPVLFKFDPNNLPAEKWQQLGLSEKQVATIKNYEAKGGRFYKKEDVAKIYAITADDYKRLASYIDIPEG